MQCHAKMAMEVYWTWEKEWVSSLQRHSQQVTIWKWLHILDRMCNSQNWPNYSVKVDSRGGYVLTAPTYRVFSMRARSYALDNLTSTSPYTAQGLCDSALYDASVTASDTEVNLLQDI